ncbi:fungal zn(2)-Cys(6) binuclear clusterdomain-containing protein [Cordyceps javanica]|uniref:Fungal zn(2)-Cys(6) binuclear clusterdomain-containing protein n=1 Tax=Cordyceps javanica TaxID=43265 RepID=A0A545ULL1_9HYPO|nr:fungal zn(2)-Cys(6) binuclear clusterdomain-containing protein [Cordyceps javanica]
MRRTNFGQMLVSRALETGVSVIRINQGHPNLTYYAIWHHCTTNTMLTPNRSETRTKKRKCGGELPTCARCRKHGAKCQYAQSRPLGRPKKSMGGVSLASPQPNSGDAALSFEESPSDVPPRTSAPEDEGLSDMPCQATLLYDAFHAFSDNAAGHELSSFLGIDSFGLMDTSNNPSCILADGDMDVSGIVCDQAADNLQSCACLAVAHRLLAEIREWSPSSYHQDIERLRTIRQEAVELVQCSICPLRYVSLVQNVSLICGLIFSLAHVYRRIVESIDTRSTYFTNDSEANLAMLSSLVSFSNPSSPDTPCPAIDREALYLTTAAKSLIRQELFGFLPQGNTFSSLLDMFETRQSLWHACPPCSDYPAIYIHGIEKTPMCVFQSHEARRLIQTLEI